MVTHARQSCYNFSVRFYKEVICSELRFIKLNSVTLRKEGLREGGQFKKNYKSLDYSNKVVTMRMKKIQGTMETELRFGND